MLVEKRGHLGGRAYSFADPVNGLMIDNCQHVLLGCCSEAVDFLRRIGSLELIEFTDCITLIDTSSMLMRLRASPLPAPYHAVSSLLRGCYLSVREKAALVRVLIGLRANVPAPGISAADYLRDMAVPNSLVRKLFEPILVSALNETSSEADAFLAREMLKKLLFESRHGCSIGVPRVPLVDIFDLPARRLIEHHGGEVRMRTGVAGLELCGDRVTRLAFDNGDSLDCDYCVSAVAPTALESIGLATAAARAIAWRPIVAAHLYFDGDGGEFDRACLTDEPFGWVFNKSRDFARAPGYFQAVASAADDIMGAGKEEITRLAARAVVRAVPELKQSKLIRAVISREARATFATRSAAGGVRPHAEASIRNLFLAGEWTDTGWPATIEGAVISGRRAAQALLARL